MTVTPQGEHVLHVNAAEVAFKHGTQSPKMAVLNHLTATCWKYLQGDHLNKHLVVALRALHKSAPSEAFGVPASTGEDGGSPGLITAAQLADKNTRVKSLKEMPGPSTTSNLVEFFWRDGFSRIHQIQVNAPQKIGKLAQGVREKRIARIVHCYISKPLWVKNKKVNEDCFYFIPLCQPFLPLIQTRLVLYCINVFTLLFAF